MKTLKYLIDTINRSSIPARPWVGGSFLTGKLNPHDFNITLVVVESVLQSMSVEQRSSFDWFRTTSLYDKHRCENYGVVIDANRADGEWLYAYWLRQFGFGRVDGRQGIVEILVPFFVPP